MTKRRLLIASPAKGGLPLHFLVLHERLLRRPPDGWEIDYIVEGANSCLNVSRNILANHAIAEGYERIIMLDTDHPCGIEHVERILSHNVDVVSPLYCLKKPGKPFWLGIAEPGAKPTENNLLPAAFLPTGMLSISVAALKRMQAAHPDREVYVQDNVLLPPNATRTNTTMFELFPVGTCGPRTPAARIKRIRKLVLDWTLAGGFGNAYMERIAEALNDPQDPGYLVGEDYHFSLLAKQAGIDLYLDVGCVIPHKGQVDFPITDPEALATTSDRVPELAGDPSKW